MSDETFSPEELARWNAELENKAYELMTREELADMRHAVEEGFWKEKIKKMGTANVVKSVRANRQEYQDEYLGRLRKAIDTSRKVLAEDLEPDHPDSPYNHVKWIEKRQAAMGLYGTEREGREARKALGLPAPDFAIRRMG